MRGAQVEGHNFPCLTRIIFTSLIMTFSCCEEFSVVLNLHISHNDISCCADSYTSHHDIACCAERSSWGPNGAPSTPAVTGVDVSVPFALRSADGGRYEFTNYVRGYTGLLDYVFYQPERMRAREPLSLPGAAELAGWIPSQRFPSDHISLVFDLDWLPSADSEAEPAEPAGLGRSQESCSGVGGAAVAEVEQPLSSRSAETDVAWTPGSASGGAQTIARGAAAMVVAGSELGQEGGRGGSEAAVPRRGAVLAANERNAAAAAAEALGRGDVVAVPTDTLYGLAACANSKEVRICGSPSTDVGATPPHYGPTTDIESTST